MKVYCQIILLSLVLISTGHSQTHDFRNVVYGNLGIVPGGSGTININYERWLGHLAKKETRHITARASYGVTDGWNGSSKVYSVSVNRLSGPRRNLIDIGLGIAAFDDDYTTELDLDWVPHVHVGYRYSARYFMFRTGLAVPEGIYLGLGITF